LQLTALIVSQCDFSNAKSGFNGFPDRGRLLKQFSVSIAATPGLSPVKMQNGWFTGQNA